MTDTQLADAFHSKFYSDIPKDTFYTQLGIKTTPVSSMELMFGAGSPIARTIKGAVVDPALAVNQLLASTGLFGKDIKQGATQLVSDVEQATLSFSYRIIETPLREEVLMVDKAFKNYVGAVLEHILTDALETGEYKLGSDDSNNDTEEPTT
jgi:hypothetical protein